MAQRYDLRIDQGATCAMQIECQDETGAAIDLTGCAAAAQVRYKHTDTDAAATFTATVSASTGVINLGLTAAQTAALTKTYGVWDCELTFSDGTKQRLVEGKVSISPEVTK